MGTSQGPPLYGRDPLLRALIPRLTGLAHDERSRVPREHQGDVPAVLVTGRHGMGRTALLAKLAEGYRDRLPLAQIRAVPPGSVALPAAAGPPGGAAVASSFVEVLAELVCALGPELRRRFPVLLPGLFAVYGWREGNDEEREASCLLLARLLLACRLERGSVDALRHSLATAVEARLEASREATDSGSAYGTSHGTPHGTPGDARDGGAPADAVPEDAVPEDAVPPGHAGPPGHTAPAGHSAPGRGAPAHGTPAGPAPAAGARYGDRSEPDGAELRERVTAALLAEYAERHPVDGAPDWFRRAFGLDDSPDDGSDDDAPSPLVRLGAWFHQGGDYRHAAEQALMGALLHDIGASYGRLQRWNRDPWPLLLLDDVQHPAGARFLDLLLEHRARPEGPQPHAEELVVVATRLGELPESPAAVRRELPELVRASGWRRTDLSPHAGLLAVPLPPLSRDDVLPLLATGPRTRPLHPYLASAVHSLTGGHPAATTMLCAAVVHTAGRGDPVTPGNLLDLTTKGGRPITEALLERLIPDRRQRDRLTLLSPARDGAAAAALAAHLRLEGPEQLPANAVAEYLEAQQWQQLTPQDGPLVTDGLLQSLLVHEARRISPGVDDRRGWREIHGFLHRHHVQRADGEADALRHSLAAGDAATVVAALAEEFQSEQNEQGAAHWLFCLQYAATAPTPPARDWADERMDVALGAHDGRYADLVESERCVNRLLHALWCLSEPQAEPENDLCQAVGDELAYLSPRHPSWHAALSQAARSWPAAARKKRPFPISRQ
ncbi:ATP-binding protein [Streptomyces boluensis]|uniref:ATP-binding protein n=1 Tax=Streptomyces boluensis TaxID=1775135 RepID=A0A964XP05_9ACTN|nr:ATP-binding protein [Streptomyces boluensis]NBE54726.1 ATP-binding protein [Streptomyces boluensis]